MGGPLEHLNLILSLKLLIKDSHLLLQLLIIRRKFYMGVDEVGDGVVGHVWLHWHLHRRIHYLLLLLLLLMLLLEIAIVIILLNVLWRVPIIIHE